MNYYLVRLSYTPAAWKELVETTTSLDGRLNNVRRLVKQLGGSFANYHFFDAPNFEDKARRHIVYDKFVPFGEHDIVTIIAMPDNVTARTFHMAIAAEDGVKAIEVMPMISMEEAVGAMGVAKSARARASYAAPGRAAAPARAPARRRK